MATTTHMNTIRRIGRRVLRGVERARLLHGRQRSAAGRDELARLGLITVAAESRQERSVADSPSSRSGRTCDERPARSPGMSRSRDDSLRGGIMQPIAMKRRMKRILPRALRTWAETGARPLLPLLGPFLVSLVFILLYCGPNVSRGLACLMRSHLLLASGPRSRAELGADGSKTFSTHHLGTRVMQVVQKYCSRCPAWWSLDFWVDPDPHDVVSVENLPSNGTEDSVRRLLARRADPDRVDLAILRGWPDRRRGVREARRWRGREDPVAGPAASFGALHLRQEGWAFHAARRSPGAERQGLHRPGGQRGQAPCSEGPGSSQRRLPGRVPPTARPTRWPGR